MTRIIFVRHAQPVHSHTDDRTRPLTDEGLRDTQLVLDTLKDMQIDAFYCSPYKRSLDTIASTAEYFSMQITTDERLRERQSGKKGNGGVGVSFKDMINKRWSDKQWHEEGGEALSMVQESNIEAVTEIAAVNEGKTIAIGTNGTALSTILNYYDPDFGAEDFFRIVDWMPYIVELDIENGDLVSKTEIAHIEKEYKG